MTKDILFSPISRAPSIWIAFAEIAAVPVLFESDIFSYFFLFTWWKSYWEQCCFSRQTLLKTKYTQWHREDEHSTFQYKTRKQGNRKHKHYREQKKKQTLTGACYHIVFRPWAGKWKVKNHFMTCDQRNMFKTTFHKHNKQTGFRAITPTNNNY